MPRKPGRRLRPISREAMASVAGGIGAIGPIVPRFHAPHPKLHLPPLKPKLPNPKLDPAPIRFYADPDDRAV